MNIYYGGLFGKKTVEMEGNENFPVDFLAQAADAFDPMLLASGKMIFFTYREAPEVKFKRMIKSYDPQVSGIMDLFVGLYIASSDSIEAQDALIAYYRKIGLIGGNYVIDDDEARRAFDDIVTDQSLSNIEKDAYLSALDVAVLNHHPHGMAAEILNEIHAAQGELVLKLLEVHDA